MGTLDYNAWFVLSLANFPYNTSNCSLVTGSKLDFDGETSKCTLMVNATYNGQQNSSDLYELSIINYERVFRQDKGKLRQRRDLLQLVEAFFYDPGSSYSYKERIKDRPESSPKFGKIEVDPEILWFKRHFRTLQTALKELLEDENPPIESDDVKDVFDRVNRVLDVRNKEKIPPGLLQGLDKLSTRFDLKPDHKGSVVRDNVAILAVSATPRLRLRGMRIAARADDDAFAENTFKLVTENNEESLQLTTDKTEALFLLPESATRVDRRISMVAFRTNRSFVDSNCQLNSKVLSINVENFTNLEHGEMVKVYLKPWKRVHHRNQSRACAYWHFNENGTGHWSQDGCTITKAKDGMLDLCQCNHLTHFAEVLIHRNVFAESDESALEIISIIGCCLSLFGLTVIALTAAVFKSWRDNDSNKIWLNLGSAVFILDVCFLVTVFVDFDYQVTGCVVVGVLLHYSVLATFCWMLVISILSYRKLVLVFNSELPCKLLIAALFAWGSPFLVIGTLFAANPYAYSGRFEEITPNGKFCYPKGLAFWMSVFGPMAVMWLVNWILYAIILRSMFVTKNKVRRHSSSKDTLKTASISCLLAFLCGIPWVFGFFAYNIVAAYLFSMTVTFQGFVLFLFFILGNKKTRMLWMNLIRNRSRRVVFVTSNDGPNKGINTARSYLQSNTSSSPDQASGSLLSESRL